MMPRLPVIGAVLGLAAAAAVTAAFVWQLWESDDSADYCDVPSMTLEGVIALVSRELAGCPDQPLLVLRADATYEGDNNWRVTYRDYEWIVNEAEGSVERVGEPLPCPGR